MGGFGSTRWGFHWTRDTTEGLLRLDVRELARAGQLRPGTWSRLWWTRNGKSAGDINLEAEKDALILTYRIKRLPDRDWQPIRERVSLTSSPCHYGGSRPWFFCPGCGRRRAVLYSEDGRFRCVKCHDLTYSSTREEPWNRASRRADKLRQKVSAGPGYRSFMPKPKGMHWNTFERIVSEIRAHDHDAIALLSADMDRRQRDMEKRC